MIPTTIDEDITNGNRRTSHRSLNHELTIKYKHDDSEVKVPCEPIISKYKDYFDKYMDVAPLTEQEQNDYRYAPKKVSLDFYGTIAYWSIILFINECHSIVEFEPVNMKYIDPNYIEDLIEEITVLEGK